MVWQQVAAMGLLLAATVLVDRRVRRRCGRAFQTQK
jgi:hypothetical protein